MKIAIIGSAHPLRGGGIATFNERMADALQEQGHEVTIWSFSLQYPSFLFPGKSQFTDEPAPKGLHIRSVINSVNPLNWLKVGRMLRNERPDLIIVRYWIPFMGPAFGTILRQVQRNRHTRILCIADNFIPHEKRPGDAAFTRYFIQPVQAFVTMSRDVLRELQEATTKPAAYHPHPLYDTYGPALTKEEACQKLGLDPARPYVLFFGFIREYKGLDLLLEALADPRLQHLHLIIAGEYYNDRARYEQLMAEKGLQERIHDFTDFIPNEEVRYYFSAADVVGLPYRSATQSGITQVAYHFEKPMVVTNVGGLAEVVPDGRVGIVTEPNPQALAEGLLRFLQLDPAQLQHNLREEKQRYSWDSFLAMLLNTAFSGAGSTQQTAGSK